MSRLNKYLDIYDNEVVLPGTGKNVTITPVTTNKIKKLLLYENENDPIKGEEILDKVILSSVKNDDFNIDDIFIQDKYFLFIELRKITKGRKFKFPYTCPNCGSQSLQSVNLDDLKIYQKKASNDNIINLLNDKLKVTMKHLTRGEQKAAYKELENIENINQKKVDMVLATLAQSVEKIETEDGEDDYTLQEKIDFFGNLPDEEYNKLNEWFENNKFGFDLNINVKCKECGNRENTIMELDNFFR